MMASLKIFLKVILEVKWKLTLDGIILPSPKIGIHCRFRINLGFLKTSFGQTETNLLIQLILEQNSGLVPNCNQYTTLQQSQNKSCIETSLYIYCVKLVVNKNYFQIPTFFLQNHLRQWLWLKFGIIKFYI